MPKKPLIVVIGADGFVGGGFAEGLQAQRVVYVPSETVTFISARRKESLERQMSLSMPVASG